MPNDENMDWVDYTAFAILAALTIGALVYMAYNFGKLLEMLV